MQKNIEKNQFNISSMLILDGGTLPLAMQNFDLSSF